MGLERRPQRVHPRLLGQQVALPGVAARTRREHVVPPVRAAPRQRNQVVPGEALPVATWFRCRGARSEEHTSELQSQSNLVCRLLLEKKKSSFLLEPLPKTLIPVLHIGRTR